MADCLHESNPVMLYYRFSPGFIYCSYPAFTPSFSTLETFDEQDKSTNHCWTQQQSLWRRYLNKNEYYDTEINKVLSLEHEEKPVCQSLSNLSHTLKCRLKKNLCSETLHFLQVCASPPRSRCVRSKKIYWIKDGWLNPQIDQSPNQQYTDTEGKVPSFVAKHDSSHR